MNDVSVPILVFPRKLGGWHKHAHANGGDPYMTSCWKPECWEAEDVIRMCAEDLSL